LPVDLHKVVWLHSAMAVRLATAAGVDPYGT
jgi:hypothetical protein